MSVPGLDDLLLLGASVSRYPLERHGERCGTHVTLGGRFATRPIELTTPVLAVGTFPVAESPSGMRVCRLAPSRDASLEELREADAIEVALTQDGSRDSSARHPDWAGPDELAVKLEELRELTGWERPVFVRIGAARTYYDVMLAIKAGADVVVLDDMRHRGMLAADPFLRHVGIPLIAAIPQAAEALHEAGMRGTVQLVVCGDIRSGADLAKALALGADAIEVRVGELAAGLQALVLETQEFARACGKSHVRNLDPDDLVALTVEAAAMARVPLAGTQWVPGSACAATQSAMRDEVAL